MIDQLFIFIISFL